MGFYGRESAQEPKITMHNAKLHHLAVRWTNLGLADARRKLPALMHSANCKV